MRKQSFYGLKIIGILGFSFMTACQLLVPLRPTPPSEQAALTTEAAPDRSTTLETTAVRPASPSTTDTLKTLRELREAATVAFDSNHPVEALRQLVGLLGIHESTAPETVAARAAERSELVRQAESELLTISARFGLEPTDEWLVDGVQAVGSTRQLALTEGLRPAVRLVINYDFGKAVVADAPLRFGFIQGRGELNDSVTTDAFGVAATTVRSLARADEPAVIRAMLVISNHGKTRSFTEVFRDFTFLPPSRTARILALERAQGQIKSTSDHSPLVDTVARALAGSGLELLPMEGAIDPELFMAAMGGKPEAVKTVLTAGGRNAAYLVAALAEYQEPRQMVYQDKLYNIYTCDARATVRLLRSDGSVWLSRPELTVRGQAGTPEAAIQAALKMVREAVEKDLTAANSQIKRALD